MISLYRNNDIEVWYDKDGNRTYKRDLRNKIEIWYNTDGSIRQYYTWKYFTDENTPIVGVFEGGNLVYTNDKYKRRFSEDGNLV